MILPWWQLILGGGGVVVIAFAIWLTFRYVKKSGETEARLRASEEAREAETEWGQIQGETRTEEELRDRIRGGTFGGQKGTKK